MKIFNTPDKEKTEHFYNQLTEGKVERSTLGVDQRFNIEKLLNKKIVRKNYLDFVVPYCDNNSTKVLDFGCGPGTFSFMISPHCHQVDGVDISQGFINAANNYKDQKKFQNIKFFKVGDSGDEIPNDYYDLIILVDVIHHLEKIDPIIQSLNKKLKTGGKVLIFEPNILNPVILLMHVLDSNEWGLLKLGVFWKYKKYLKQYFKNINYRYNGIVIGPENKVFYFLSGLLNHKWLYPLIGWLNPKIFIAATKK